MEFNATFIIVTISFIVFVFVMNTILYRPLEQIVKKREELISGNYENAESLNSEAKSILEKKAQEIAQAKINAKLTIDNETKKAYDNSSNQIQKEKENSLTYINEQKEILQLESENLQKNMDKDIQEYAELIANKILNKNTGNKNE